MRALLFTLFASLPAFIVMQSFWTGEFSWTFNLCSGFVSFMFTQIWIAAIISGSKK
jgi:hypothetical protein